MPTKTSPTLVKDAACGEELVDAMTDYCCCCLEYLRKHVEVPDAKFYDVQVSTRQWRDRSGTAVEVARVGGDLTYRQCGDGGYWGEMYVEAEDFLKDFGVTAKPMTIYWRLRYWN